MTRSCIILETLSVEGMAEAFCSARFSCKKCQVLQQTDSKIAACLFVLECLL